MRTMAAQSDDHCLTNYVYKFSPDVLKDQVAFITGGGSGIGMRIAEILMRHGCDTVICSRKAKRLQEAAVQLRKATGRRCVPLVMDVRQHDQVEETVKSALDQLKKINILVNAAAGNFLSPASSLSAKGFRTVMEIDIIGTYTVCKTVYDLWMKANGGNIINISATLHYTGTVLQAHAGSAKAAIDALTKHLAVEWGPENIRINCIAPGPIEGTEGLRKLGGASQSAMNFLLNTIPLQRLGTRTEIGEAVVFLCSEAASYITGAVLVVDGGHWMVSGRSLHEITSLFSKL